MNAWPLVGYARQRLAQKIDYAPLAFRVLPGAFTMSDLRAVHEVILGRPLHPSNFVKAMRARWDLEAVPNALDRRAKRPAQLYRYAGPRDIPGPPRQAAGSDWWPAWRLASATIDDSGDRGGGADEPRCETRPD